MGRRQGGGPSSRTFLAVYGPKHPTVVLPSAAGHASPSVCLRDSASAVEENAIASILPAASSASSTSCLRSPGTQTQDTGLGVLYELMS